MIGDILQPTHLLFILVIALLVLGPKRLPEVGRSLGRGLRDFRMAISGEDHEQVSPPSPSPAPKQPEASDIATDLGADPDATPRVAVADRTVPTADEAAPGDTSAADEVAPEALTPRLPEGSPPEEAAPAAAEHAGQNVR